MEKLKNYVIYLFKVNQINDLTMQEEITANLIEKYDHLLNEGLDEEKAYIETIKSIGNLNLEEKPIEQKFAYKPNWANISFYVALILGILATVVLFVSTAVSIILTAISLALYVAASYYSYHLSQYVLKEERDILKHNELLRAMFGHLKTIFIFWNINISYWIAGTFTDSFIYHFILFNQKIILADDIFGLFIGRLLIALIFFIIIFILFKLFYNNLEAKYFELTKESKLDGILKNKGLFTLSNKDKMIISKTFYIILTLIYVFIISSSSHIIILSSSGSIGARIYYNLFEIPSPLNSFLGIIAIIAFILGLLFFIISIIKDNRVFRLSTFLFLLLTVIMMNVTLSSINTSLDYYTEFDNIVTITSIFAFLYMTYQFVLIIQAWRSNIKKIS